MTIIYSIIPAKGFSARLKNKNILKINNKSLVEFSIEHSKLSKLINKTFLSTDSERIINIGKKHNIEIIKRPKRLCLKNSSSEDVIIHALSKIIKNFPPPDIVVFLQATSPYREKNHLDMAINKFIKLKSDSMFCSNLYKNKVWKIHNKKLLPVNHNNRWKIMSQDKKDQLEDNGSFYIFNFKKFLIYKNRLFGKIDNFNIDAKYGFQIDSRLDFEILKTIMH